MNRNGLLAAIGRCQVEDKITIDKIIRLAPMVGRILAEARALKEPTWTHYERFKRRLGCWVGWGANHPELGAADAYDVCVQALADALKL